MPNNSSKALIWQISFTTYFCYTYFKKRETKPWFFVVVMVTEYLETSNWQKVESKEKKFWLSTKKEFNTLFLNIFAYFSFTYTLTALKEPLNLSPRSLWKWCYFSLVNNYAIVVTLPPYINVKPSCNGPSSSSSSQDVLLYTNNLCF